MGRVDHRVAQGPILQTENARLRQLLEEAGLNAERAAVLMAQADAEQQREIERLRDQADHQRWLAAEMHHRVKNVLSVAQAVASQTLRFATSLEEAKAALANRLAALGHAQDLLLRQEAEGMAIRVIVDGTVKLYGCGIQKRFQARGPEVVLLPRAALALTLTLHELCTNAMKYGALSTIKGHVEIQWWVENSVEQSLHILWREHEGPRVAPPEKAGFGSRLIERMLAADFCGAAVISYDPAGVTCKLEGRLAGISPSPLGYTSGREQEAGLVVDGQAGHK